MKAVVLVGGEGTRLRPLTLSTPKPLLPVGTRPFLEHQLRWLASAGVDEVILSLGYLPHAFEAHFADGEIDGVKLHYAVEDEPLGTAGAIRFAADGVDERLLVCNGDVLTTLDLPALLAFHEARGAEATIALTRVEDPSAYGVVPTRDDGEVVAFVEKPPRETAPTTWINAGTYVLEPGVLERIPPRLAVSIERETFPRMLEAPRVLFAMASDAYWLDIGTPQTYLQANRDLVSGRFGAEACADGVMVGDGATIDPGATVAESVVGRGCAVEAGARVERSVLHDGARVGAGAAVLDSVVGAHAVVGRDARVTDVTLVEAGAEVPARTQVSGGRVAAGR